MLTNNNTQQEKRVRSKQPFLLKFSCEEKPRRVFSLNRLNYPQNLQKDGTFVAKKDIIQHQLFDHHVVQNNIKIEGELKKLQLAYIHEKVPEFYAYYFMNRLAVASEQKIQDNITKELEEVKAKRSFYHVITNAIRARQGCLKQLQRCLENLFNNQEDNVTKHVLREEIIHYRKLTGFVVSHIRAWKQFLNDISPEVEFTTFIYNSQDYLIKLLNDCQFIFNSFLTRHLKFSYRNDPFIIRPFIDGRDSKYLELFKLEDDEKVHYMIDLNYLAGERAKYLESKMNSKNEKIKQIQRIYHYKDAPLSSRLIVRKLPNSRGEKINEIKDKPEIAVDNFMEGDETKGRKGKLEEISKNTHKIKQIKQIFGKTSQSNTRIINENMFSALGVGEGQSLVTPYQQKLKYTQYHQKTSFSRLNFQSDFQHLLRKKELEVLKGESINGTKTQRSFRNIKIKDDLSSNKKSITNEEAFTELEKILNQLDTFSPQKLDHYKLKKKQDIAISSEMKFNQGKLLKTRVVSPPKTLIEHNEEVYATIRNKVIQQIQKGIEERELFEEKRKRENQQIQSILQKKINEQSLNILKNSRATQLVGRENLAKQIESSQLFGYEEKRIKNSEKLSTLEEQLKKEMQLKWLREVQQQLKRKTEISELEQIRRKQEQQLNKKTEKIKQRQQLEKRYQEIEKEEKAKAVKEIVDLNEQRKKQIEEEMKIIIEKEKQTMEKFASAQRSEVEQQLKEAMKSQMLARIRDENQRYYDNSKKQEQRAKKELEYREQVRNKIEQQYKVGQQMKKNRERQQKLAKVKIVKEKLQELDSSSKKPLGKGLEEQSGKNKKGLDQQNIKSRISQFPDFRESLFPKFQRSSDLEKKKLRQQFQLELFAFRQPGSLEQGENSAAPVYEFGKIPIKDYRAIIDKEIIKQADEKKQDSNDIEQINLEKPNLGLENPDAKSKVEENNGDQFDSGFNKTLKSEINSDKFTKFSRNQDEKQKQKNQQDELIRMKLGMTFEEYEIYKKKKKVIANRRDTEAEISRRNQDQAVVTKILDSFEKMENLIRKPQSNDMNDDLPNQASEVFPDNLSSKNEKKGVEMKKNKEEEFVSKAKIVSSSNSEKKNASLMEQQQDIKKSGPKKLIEAQILTVNSRIGPVEKRFQTLGSEEEQEKPRKQNRKVSRIKKKSQSNRLAKQQKKSTKKEELSEEYAKVRNPLTTKVKKREIPVSSMWDFFQDHFDHLPKVIRKISIYKKEQLIKFLLGHSSFTILQFIKQNVSMGLGVVLYNENKTKYRSLNIVHLGSYDESDYLELLLQVSKYCLKSDPCEEITMSNIYDKQQFDQWEFVKNFEKQFDPYGAMFQKKIFNSQFQRKLVLRRNIGEVCRVEPLTLFNRGTFQLRVNSFITESSDQPTARQIVESDQYEEINYNIGYYGLLAYYISERFGEEALAYLISKSTEKKSTMIEKSVGSLAKLSLAMKKAKSFQRLAELTQKRFSKIMDLNLQLLSNQESVVPYPPEAIETPLECIWMCYNLSLQLSYDFYSQTIPIKVHGGQGEYDEFECKYLRYAPNKKNKMFTLKSSAYSSKITVLPCKDSKYRLFVMDSEQYDGILRSADVDQQRLDLGVYLRVFFANSIDHEQADYDYVWIPEIETGHNKNEISNLQEYGRAEVASDGLLEKERKDLFCSGVIRSHLNCTYSDYLGNSLIVRPTHRDLVVTPPFILGILHMQVETALEGSPVFVQRVGKSEMSYIKEIVAEKKHSD